MDSNTLIESIKKYLAENGTVGWMVVSTVAMFILFVILWLFGPSLPFYASEYLMLSAGELSMFYRPWTWFTYFTVYPVSGGGLLNMIFDLLILTTFARMFSGLLGKERLNILVLLAIPSLAILAGLLGFVLGAGALVSVTPITLLIVFGIIAISPDYPINVWGVISVKILWIGVILLAIEILNYRTGPTSIAAMIGAAAGFWYAKSLRNGHDITVDVRDAIENLRRKPKNNAPFIKVKYKKEEASKPKITQEDIDKILDKITEKGYHSLSPQERDALENFAGKRRSDD